MKINNLSFTGYSNIISSEIPTDNGKYMLLSMKLDDVGTQDLTAYRNLKSMRAMPLDVVNKDTLTLFQPRVNRDLSMLFFNDEALLTGNGLKKLEERACSMGKLEDIKPSIKFHMKAYTFFADLTRRLMNENNPVKRDVDFYNVFFSAKAALSNVFKDSKTAEQFMIMALDGYDAPFQVVAKNFNDSIAKTMRAFFK